MLKQIRSILKTLFPPKCIFCGRLITNHMFAVCEECLGSVPFNSGTKCKICAQPLDVVYGDLICKKCRKGRKFNKVYAPFIYKESVRKMLISYKFYGKVGYARTLAAFLLMNLKEETAPDFDMITFVPIDVFRLGVRGYNQSELIAEYLSEMSGIPLCKTLKKPKHTKPLSGVKHINRAEAVRGKFRPIKNINVKGKRVILVDDVFTTGSTAGECAAVLKRCGADEVHVGVIARTVNI